MQSKNSSSFDDGNLTKDIYIYIYFTEEEKQKSASQIFRSGI